MANQELTLQFNKVVNSAKAAIKNIFPVKGKTRTIELKDILIEDKIQDDDYRGQSAVKAKGGTWGVPVVASLELKSNDGHVLDKANIRLFLLPKITPRYSYIVSGNEYQVVSQLRLKSGVYTLRKQNGELKTTINLSAGHNFDLVFNESTGIFTVEKVAGAQARIPLYPMLAALNISHADIVKAWGQKIADANKMVNNEKQIEKLKQQFGIKSGSLQDYFDKTKISPETTKIILGKPFDKVSGELVLLAAKDLLDVQMNRKPATDRDSLQFKEIHSTEDFIQERLEKNSRSLLYKITRSLDSVSKTKLSEMVGPGSFNSTVESFYTTSDLSATPEQTNPMEMLSGNHKITIMGEGGIKSDQLITDNMREIHPSHFGIIDPVHSPESKRIGANLHSTIGSVKEGKDLKFMVKDHSGKVVTLSVTEAFNKKIAFPNQKGNHIRAIFKGEVIEVPAKEVDFFAESPMSMLSWSTNSIPFLAATQGNRAMMAAKQIEQAISLQHREAPLVQVDVGGGETIEGIVGKKNSLIAPEDGVIKNIDEGFIYFVPSKGPNAGTVEKIGYYTNFSLNRKSYLHHELKISKGEKVKKGQLLADMNFTKDGTLALGTNLRTAYLPYKGMTFEDGIVVTESAAEKLSSHHIHKKSISVDDRMVFSRSAFRVNYPTLLSAKNADKLDDMGVAKVGQKIEHGDIVIAAMQKREANPMVAILDKKISQRPRDLSVQWTYEDAGVVTDVQKTGSDITVFIGTTERVKIGDKLAGRFGNKGVVTYIIPDGQAPKTKDGKPVEIILNPHGIISRINVGQVYETALGNVAEKTGKPIKISNFEGIDHKAQVEKLMKDAGVKDKEELFDADGKSLGQVAVGKKYILKLFKQSQGNFSVRQGGPGAAYDANLQPLKAGGEDAAKNLDVLTMYCMLSHGARENLREMASVKSSQNDEFWKALKSGQMLPTPQTPFIYEKFENYLKAAGVDIEKNGTKMTLVPMTDHEISKLSNGKVDRPHFFRAKDLEPIKGGFLDQQKFGGFKGDKWGHIELKTPVINPMFEQAARKVLDLGTKFDDIVSGKLYLNSSGELSKEKKGLTGIHAIEKMLKDFNVESTITSLARKSKTVQGQQLDVVNKRLRILMALQKTGLSPDEAYIRRSVAVIPPKYRPMYPMQDGSITSSDVNVIYQNIGIMNELAETEVADMLPDEDKVDLQKEIQHHVTGLSGLTDLNIKGKERKGFVSEIAGTNPKEGMFIGKLLSKKQDYVGRGTIIPDSDLGVDDVGLPEEMAWKLFEPFVIRDLSKKYGITPIKAIDEIKKKTPLAKKVLELVMRDRKVLLNRAPSLHKFSIMAFKPRITSGTAIKIPHLITRGVNGDFDGDTMTVHTPISDAANDEAAKMMPSQNLYKPGTHELMMVPSQEAQIGLFYLSKTKDGRANIEKILGAKAPDVMDKKNTSILLKTLAKEKSGEEYSRIVNELKTLGEMHAYNTGFSVGVSDIPSLSKDVKHIVEQIKKDFANKNESGDAAMAKQAQNDVDDIISKRLKNTNSPLFDMVDSGARGSKSNLRSIVASPMIITDARGKIIRKPIENSYAEGLEMHDYWLSMYGARRGMMDRAIQTSVPGAFAKDVMANVLDNVISAKDCGTKRGMMMPVDSHDIISRCLAGDQAGFKHNTIVTTSVIKALQQSKLKTVNVRSPLTCLQAKGMCACCFGLDEHGKLPEVGENVGVKSGQAISEPLTQMTMNCEDGLILNSKQEFVTMLDFYESMQVKEELIDNKCFTKSIQELVAGKNNNEVFATTIQRHLPDDKILLLTTKTGHSILCQANHPLIIKNKPLHKKFPNNVCRLIGDNLYVDTISRVPFSTDQETAEVLAGSVNRLDCIWIDRTPALSGSVVEPDLDGYFIGQYVSDGCCRYGNGTEKYTDVPVAAIITRANGPIKNYLISRIGDLKHSVLEKDIQFYGLEIARKISSFAKGRHAWEKRLPPGFNKFSNKWLRDFLDGMIDGDCTTYIKNNTTICKFYSSSYYLIQQLQVIAVILGIKFNTRLASRAKLAKHSQFTIEFRFPEGYKSNSIKLNAAGILPLKMKKEVPVRGFDVITNIQEVYLWDRFVYDLKTHTQEFMLGMVQCHNSFHTGGTAGSGVTGFKRIDQLLKLPKTVALSASLAPVGGKIKEITPGLAGGFDVKIGTSVTHVANGLKLKVHEGEEVSKGDPLSDGVIKPQDLAALKGMRAAQEYISGELQRAYAGEGVRIDRRIFETVVRSTANTTKVVNNPNNSDFIPGDIIPYTVAMHHNENLITDVPTEESLGEILEASIGGLRVGHEITDKDIKTLVASGVKHVTVKREPIIHQPLLKNITTLPILRKNWMAALGYRNLAKALIEASGQSWDTDLEDYHPIPGLAYGKLFGKGKEGKY